MNADASKFTGDAITWRLHYRKMDFGLGEILERFEKHFGATATKILLGIISIALVGVCLHAIWLNIITPSWKAIQWLFDSNHFQFPSTHDIISNLISAVIGLIAYLLLLKLFERYIKLKTDQLKAESANIEVEITAIRSQLNNILKESQKIEADWNQMMQMWEEYKKLVEKEDRGITERRSKLSPPEQP